MENKNMVSAESERRRKPINIFIDSNELLIKNHLLNLSLLTILGQLNTACDFGIYLCEVAKNEIIKNVALGINKEIKDAKRITNQLAELKIISQANLPDEIGQNQIEEKINDQFAQNGIQIIPLSILKIEDYHSMVSDAINYTPPFEEQHEKGFKDECIILSYINFIKENKLEKAANFLLSNDEKVNEALKNRPIFSLLHPIKDLQQSLPKQDDPDSIEMIDTLEKTLEKIFSNSETSGFQLELMKYLSLEPSYAIADFESIKLASAHKTIIHFYNPEVGVGLATFFFVFEGEGRIKYLANYEAPEVTEIVGSAKGNGSALLLFDIDEKGAAIFPSLPVFTSETRIDIDSIDVDADYYRDLAEDMQWDEYDHPIRDDVWGKD